MERDLLTKVIATTIAYPDGHEDARGFDLEAIADELLRNAPDTDLNDLDPAEFWMVVEKHRRRP